MPHFVIDCSDNVLASKSADELLKVVHRAAEATGLFDPSDIKVRVRDFNHFFVANAKDDFIHVFANIMEGRAVQQRANLSREIVTKLRNMFPAVSSISVNVFEFEKATYCNRHML